jgi:Lar family restriction alleviation protein
MASMDAFRNFARTE